MKKSLPRAGCQVFGGMGMLTSGVSAAAGAVALLWSWRYRNEPFEFRKTALRTLPEVFLMFALVTLAA